MSTELHEIVSDCPTVQTAFYKQKSVGDQVEKKRVLTMAGLLTMIALAAAMSERKVDVNCIAV